MKWPIYPKYKDSGVDWLGEVPERWSLRRLRFLCKFNPSKSEVSLPAMTIVSFLPMEAVGEEGELSLSEAILQDVYNGYTYFRDQDVLVAKITPCFENGKGALASELMNGLGFGTTEFHVLRPCDQIIPKFLYYLTKTAAFRLIGEASMIGAAGQKRVPESFIADFPCSFPSVAIQQDIVTALDVQLNQIQTLIAEQEKLITLLQEKRQAVISHAVTKGLNPDAPMKDSGVEWLGMVPDSWNIKHLKYTAKILRGKFTHRPRNDPRFYDGDYPFIQTGDITEAKRYVTSYRQTLNELGTSVSMEFPKDTLVMSIAANIGDVAILTFPAYFPDSIVGFHPNNAVCLDFLYYYMISLKSQLLKNSTVSTQLNINIEQIGAISAVCPPYDEQESIVKYLDQVTGDIEDLMNAANNAIALLRERRTALISAAVTGKIDVRGLTASEPA